MTRSVCVLLAAFLIGTAVLVEAQSTLQLDASVPFVGCRADGQSGPVDAPNGKSMALPISPEATQRLAYYKSVEGLGVLAPRGWYCFGVYGSNGYVLYVSPQPIISANLFSTTWSGFAGSAIQLTWRYGDTSGRFDVAHTIARVFPAHKEFVQQVVEEGIEPASSFPLGPYPKDILTYRSNDLVEYETPANTAGLGTDSRLEKNANPIGGMAILLGETPDLAQLAVRLPADAADLAPIIIQQAERDAMHAADVPQQGK
jgi:hypothetical protein